jgi:hypothetical protein
LLSELERETSGVVTFGQSLEIIHAARGVWDIDPSKGITLPVFPPLLKIVDTARQPHQIEVKERNCIFVADRTFVPVFWDFFRILRSM